jgi:Helicase conserved C-terminal domain
MLSDAAALQQLGTALSAELDAVWAAVTAQYIQSIADTYKRRKVQVFCSSVERAKLLTTAINDAATLWLNNDSMSDRMLVANCGSGELSDSDRQQLAAYLRRWPEESLCYCCVTCLLFQESLNVPDLDCVIETSGCQSLVYTLQRVGRVMRWLAGKQFGLWCQLTAMGSKALTPKDVATLRGLCKDYSVHSEGLWYTNRFSNTAAVPAVADEELSDDTLSFDAADYDRCSDAVAADSSVVQGGGDNRTAAAVDSTVASSDVGADMEVDTDATAARVWGNSTVGHEESKGCE